MKCPDISITFGMHNGHSFTYCLFMRKDDKWCKCLIDQFAFRKQIQGLIEEGMEMLK